MIEIVRTVLNRQQDTLWQDALGGVALVVILLGSLHLPTLF
jgi:hypothetical protein